jgi:NADH-quinone oxidoreductase subunit M
MMWFGVIATTGMVVTTGYIVYMIRRVYWGAKQERWAHFPDLDARELIMLTPLVIVVVFLGIYPAPALHLMQATMNGLLALML